MTGLPMDVTQEFTKAAPCLIKQLQPLCCVSCIRQRGILYEKANCNFVLSYFSFCLLIGLCQDIFSQYGSVKEVTVLPVAAGKTAAAAFVILHTAPGAAYRAQLAELERFRRVHQLLGRGKWYSIMVILAAMPSTSMIISKSEFYG